MMQDTSNGLPLPRHVAEHSERRGKAIGHLAAAAAELESLTADTAKLPNSRRNVRLMGGYVAAAEAVQRTVELVNGLNEYHIDTSRGDARLLVDAGSCMCWPFAPHPDCPVHPSSFRDGFSVRVPDPPDEWAGVYPGMCVDPDICRGKSSCPRNYSCCE